MTTGQNKKNISGHKLAIFVFVAITAGSGFVAPYRANAQSTAATCAVSSYLGQLITSKISGLLGSVGSSKVPNYDTSTANEEKKSFVLDRLASCAAKELLHQMVVSTVNWINSGFNGSPAYLSNPEGFFLDTADQVTGQIISNSGPLQALCSPWNADIRLTLALAQTQPINQRYTCTLGTIINSAANSSVNGYSIQGFVNGDFSQGGWPAFIGMSTDPSNNPYGIYLQAHSDQLYTIGQRQSSISQELLQGSGFLPDKICNDVSVSDAQKNQLGDYGMIVGSDGSSITMKPDGSGYQRCVVGTPGEVLANTLNKHLGTGVDEVVNANDINAVVNALLTQLVNQMLSKGLSSLSSSGSGTTYAGASTLDSFTQQLQNDSSAGQVSQAYTTAVNIVTTVQQGYQAVLGCYTEKLNNSSTPSAYMNDIQSSISAINNTLQNQIAPLLSSLTSKQAIAQSQNGQASINSGTANADLAAVQTQANTFTQEINNYQSDCDSIGSTPPAIPTQ